MRREKRLALGCAAVATVTAGLALGFSLHVQDWRVSGLVRMQPDEAMASYVLEDDPDFAFVPAGHYDGVYAYAIARDPLALGRAHTLIDFPAYRYGRAGYGWLAFGASAGGRPSLVPWALLLVGLVGMVGGSFAASLTASKLGFSGWGGLVVALNPGVIYGLTVNTSEPISALLLALVVAAWVRERLLLAMAGMVYLCLIKEPFLAVPLGIALWELARRARGVRVPDLGLRVGVCAASVLPLAVWWTYLNRVFGEWPVNQPWLIERPLVGWFDTMRQAADMGLAGFNEMQIGTIVLPLLVAVGVAFVLAAVRALSIRTPLDPIFLGMMAIFSVLSWWQLLYPKEMFRILAIPLGLLPAILARAPRTPVSGEARETGLDPLTG